MDAAIPTITFGSSSGQASGNVAGGVVSITQMAGSTITTGGINSAGIIAQSIGSGGGLGVLNSSSSTVNFGSGGKDSAGTVGVTLNGAVQTNGDGSPGVLAVSIGGGGGVAFVDSSSEIYGQSYNGEDGVGGAVNVTLQSSGTSGASIITTGKGSDALVASSMGGGAGLIIGSAGVSSSYNPATASGEINITLTGYNPNYQSIISSYNATAVTILGGTDDSKKPNTVSLNAYSQILNQSYNGNTSLDTTDNPDNEWAIYAPTGYTNVSNYGYVFGNILLGTTGTGEFNNYGTLEATSMTVANNSFNNYGDFYTGGYKNVANASINGSLKSYAGSNIYVDVDVLNTVAKNDNITVTGFALLAGQFVPQAKTILPGPYTFIQAGTLTDQSSMLDTQIFDWNSTVVAGNQMIGTPTANFIPVGYSLTGNQNSVASYLQQAWGKSDGGLAGLFGYMHEYQKGDQSSYQYALNQISAPSLNSQAIQMQTQFATSLGESMTCSNMTPKRIDANKDDCEWARLVGDRTTQNENSNNAGYTSSGGGIRLGAQRNLWDNVTTGYAIGYTRNYLSTSGFNSNGDFLDGSFSLKKKMGNWSLGGSAALSQGWFENKRQLMLYGNGVADSLATQYTSNSYMGTAGIRARMAYEYEQKTHYLKPYVDFDYFYSFTPSYDESGSGALALSVGSSSHSGTTVTPMLEFGADLTANSKRHIKAFVSAGASFLNNNSHTSQASFVGALSDSGTFSVVTNGPSLLERVNVGIELFESNNIQGRITYGLLTGDGYQSQNWSANLGYQF